MALTLLSRNIRTNRSREIHNELIFGAYCHACIILHIAEIDISRWIYWLGVHKYNFYICSRFWMNETSISKNTQATVKHAPFQVHTIWKLHNGQHISCGHYMNYNEKLIYHSAHFIVYSLAHWIILMWFMLEWI